MQATSTSGRRADLADSVFVINYYNPEVLFIGFLAGQMKTDGSEFGVLSFKMKGFPTENWYDRNSMRDSIIGRRSQELSSNLKF